MKLLQYKTEKKCWYPHVTIINHVALYEKTPESIENVVIPRHSLQLHCYR